MEAISVNGRRKDRRFVSRLLNLPLPVWPPKEGSIHVSPLAPSSFLPSHTGQRSFPSLPQRKENPQMWALFTFPLNQSILLCPRPFFSDPEECVFSSLIRSIPFGPGFLAKSASFDLLTVLYFRFLSLRVVLPSPFRPCHVSELGSLRSRDPNKDSRASSLSGRQC